MAGNSYLNARRDNMQKSQIKRVLATCLWVASCASIALAATTLELDIEPPDARFSSNGSYYEGDRHCWREGANQWGTWGFAQDGRYPSSPQCIKVDMPPHNSSDRDRMEWAFNGIAPNTDVWEGFSIKFADNFPCFDGTVAMFYQWKNHGHMPATQFCLAKGNKGSTTAPLKIYMRALHGNAYSPSVTQSGQITVPRGQWIDIVLNYKVTNGGGGGYMKVWVNGNNEYNYTGAIGFSDATANGNPKIGLYYLYAQNYHRTMYIDELRWGSSYEDVDPSIERNGNTVGVPVPSIPAGTYLGEQSVSLESRTSGAQIYYTLNGTTPTTGSTPYTAPIPISQTTTLKARAFKSGMDDSQVLTAQYVIEQPPEGYLNIVDVEASADDGNVPANAIDGKLDTRWSAQGMGQWITFDLGAAKTVESVWIAWYQGDNRTADFKISVSSNNTDFVDVLTDRTSSGTTLEMEEHAVTPVAARYVRITGYGNSSSDWNSITETMILGGDSTPVAQGAHRRGVSGAPGQGVRAYTIDGRCIDATAGRDIRGIVVEVGAGAHGRTCRTRISRHNP